MPVFERHHDCIEHRYLNITLRNNNRFRLFLIRTAIPYGHDACIGEMLIGGLQTPTSLIVRMVVGQSSMGDAYLTQILRPFGIRTEDVALVDRRNGIGQRTFEIDNHSIGLSELRLHTVEKECHTSMFGNRSHSPIEQHIACKKNRKQFLFPIG